MTGELLRLFSEGGGRETLARGAVVRPGPPSSSAPYAPGVLVAQTLARVQEETLEWEVATDLATAEAQSSSDARFAAILQRARDFLHTWNGDKEAAVMMLLDVGDRLRNRFAVTAWDAYWTVLHRAFRTGSSPLALTSSLVRALAEDESESMPGDR